MLRDNKLPLITLPSAYVSRLLTDTNIIKLTLLTITQLLDIYIHREKKQQFIMYLHNVNKKKLLINYLQ